MRKWVLRSEGACPSSQSKAGVQADPESRACILSVVWLPGGNVGSAITKGAAWSSLSSCQPRAKRAPDPAASHPVNAGSFSLSHLNEEPAFLSSLKELLLFLSLAPSYHPDRRSQAKWDSSRLCCSEPQPRGGWGTAPVRLGEQSSAGESVKRLTR